MAPTRFVLVRHAHTDAVGRALAGRAPGSGLNARGMEEAGQVARALSGGVVDGVICSPRLRARQTADRIGDAAGRVVEESAGLDEVDFGAWTGRDFLALDGDPEWTAWNTLRSLSPTPGGETMLQVQARAVAVLQAMHAMRPGETLVLVSHADVIRSVLAYVLGLPIELMQRIEVAPASRSVVLLQGAEVRVACVNVTLAGP